MKITTDICSKFEGNPLYGTQIQFVPYGFSMGFSCNFSLFKVVVRACYRAYFVAHILNYLAPGDLHDAIF